MASYLITGVAGFIGSNLARELVKAGHSVRGIDNFSTGRPENIAEFRNKLDFIEGSILDPGALRSTCRGIDYVLHQAAIPSVPKSVIDPITCNAVNVDGTLNVLVAAREAKVKRVVYAASSSAYGDTPSLPKHEEMQPRPISPYAVAKLTGEYYMNSFYQCYGLETVSLRYFNIFGPWQDASSTYSGVLAKFITEMLEGRQPTIYGDGEQSRDFTYIENCVQANLKATTAPAGAVCGRTFNVATGVRFTLKETFDLLCKLIGYHGNVAYQPARAGDVRHSLADISAAKSALGYEPKVDFEEGLRRTIAWYKQQMPATAAVR